MPLEQTQHFQIAARDQIGVEEQGIICRCFEHEGGGGGVKGGSGIEAHLPRPQQAGNGLRPGNGFREIGDNGKYFEVHRATLIAPKEIRGAYEFGCMGVRGNLKKLRAIGKFSPASCR